MTDIVEKANLFAALHVIGKPFLIPNPWDIGTAKLCANAGFKALATTSAGHSYTLGKPEGDLTRDEALAHAEEMAAATDLPVSADLENGFGASLAEVGRTYILATKTGLVGASIEDTTGDIANPILDVAEATDRVAAAAEAVSKCGFKFTLTGRAENYLHGRPDLDDTILRLKAYEAAGADVLYAPGLSTFAEIKSVTDEVSKPVNVLAGVGAPPLDMAALADAGAARVSVGSHLARLALGTFAAKLQKIAQTGDLDFSGDSLSWDKLNDIFSGSSRS